MTLNSTPSLDAIQKASQILSDRLFATPIAKVTVPTSEGDIPCLLKLENLHAVGSFKARGNAYKFHQLFSGINTVSKYQRAPVTGVITMSAGNHAQGVAANAHFYDIPAVIVMPEDTPQNKIAATEKWGAEIVLAGQTLAESQEVAQKLQSERHLALIHPYDDPDIIIGQGTCGLELYQQAPECTAVLIPIGGGGLGAGMAIAQKALNPAIKLYGVQTQIYPAMKAAVEGASFDAHTSTPTLAEGIAVKKPGHLTRALVAQHFETIFTVSEKQIENAIYDLATRHKIIAEGAAAAAYAALQENAALFARGLPAVVITGGNIDTRILTSILLRGMVTHHKLLLLDIPTKDTPGQLAAIAAIIAQCRGNIVKVNHQRLFHAATPKEIAIEILIETRNRHHEQEILTALREQGFHPKEKQETLVS